jgi:N6-L-threonylcarbamoyladenine synthase
LNTSEDIVILAVESSCDDTAAAVIKNGKILANVVAGQDVHKNYGGVVPELASRSHQENIVPVVNSALENAGIDRNELDAVACTQGPGLLGSLLVGISFTKAFSLALDVPLIGINHLQAHVSAHYIDAPRPSFPYLCLLVSGGHTRILKVTSETEMTTIGETLDDAAGEAFDKSAKLLGLDYPGGPLIDKFAKNGDPNKYTFSTSGVKEFNYSFSGLKTSILYFLRDEIKKDENFIQENMNDLCASIQKTIVDYLISKLIKAAEANKISEIALAGGVSANSELRERLQQEGRARDWNTYIPKFEYCTDNAAMIAMSAHHKYLAKEFSGQDMKPYAREEV